MKKPLIFALALLSSTAFAGAPDFANLSQSDVENVAREFSANFSHTGVSAPETDGLWGVELGVVAGKTTTPDLDDAGDVANLYHAGLMSRVHLPFEIFAEVNLLPEQELSELTIKNTSYEIGWNAGRSFGMPLDLAIGINFATTKFSFDQTSPTSTVEFSSNTRIMWVGISKSLLFITPYAKVGAASAETDIESTGSILSYQVSQKDTVDNSGSYFALGANLQLAFLKFGIEASQIMSVSRVSGKMSFDF